MLPLHPIWLVTNGVGRIDRSGVLTARSTDGTGTVLAIVGGQSGSGRVVVEHTENVAPTLQFSATPTSGMAPFNVTASLLATDSDGEIASGTLDWGDGTIDALEATSAAQSATHTYTEAGNYTIAAVVVDDDDASATKIAAVQVTGPTNELPTATLTVTPTSGLIPLEVTFTVSGSDPDGSVVSWLLDFGDDTDPVTSDTAPDQRAVAHTYTIVANSEARLTVIDDAGATAVATQSVSSSSADNTAPTASLTAQPTSGVAPLTVTFTGSGTDDGAIANYSLDFGDDSTPLSAATAPSGVEHVYASVGSYAAKLTVTDDEGARGSVTRTITVTEAPVLLVSPTSLAFGTSETTLGFGIFNDGAGTLEWDCSTSASWLSLDVTSGAGAGTVNITVSRAAVARGDYSGVVTVDSNGGQETVAVTMTVNNHRPTITGLTAEPVGVIPGGTSALDATATDIDGDTLTYSWSASGGTLSGTTATATWTAPSAEGQYTITCGIDDGHGGSTTDSVNILVDATAGGLTVDVD